MPRRRRPMVSDWELEPRIAPSFTPPTLVRDLNLHTGDSNPNQFTAFNGFHYFIASDEPHGSEIWRTDGTIAGTTLFCETVPGPTDLEPRELEAVGGLLYFSTIGDVSHNKRLWVTDGTVAGTKSILDTHFPSLLTNVAGTLFFVANGELWKSNGAAAGTVMVRDIEPTSSSDPENLTNLGGVCVFRASTIAAGKELWRSDGTSLGTVLVRDINPGGGGSGSYFSDARFAAVSDTLLFFDATQPGSGNELWRTDGTSAGTVLVRDIVPGTTSGYPFELTAVGSTVFFTAEGTANNRELWKSDGTSAGTVLVRDLALGGASWPRNLTNAGGTLWFTANPAVNTGYELFKSDGTSLGTVLVRDLYPGSGSGLPQYFTAVGGTVYFTATNNGFNSPLWATDGTSAGTRVVRDTSPLDGSNAAPQQLFNRGGTLFFAGVDPVAGRELFRSDGTAAGTVLVKDIDAATDSGGGDLGGAKAVFNWNGTLYFSGNDHDRGLELWKTDGTAAGTVLVRDIEPLGGTTSDSDPQEFAVFNGLLYFTAYTGNEHRELWRTDGTSAGTVLVRDIHPGNVGSYPRDLTVAGGQLFFSADSPAGRELWASDGTSIGTRLVRDILPDTVGSGSGDPRNPTAVNGALVFFAYDGANFDLWRSDGTSAGTVKITDFANNFFSQGFPGALPVLNGRMLFPSDDGVSGRELWASDGTAAGTVLVRNINTLTINAASNPALFTPFNGAVYFRACDSAQTAQIWRTDGTSAGTVKVFENGYSFTELASTGGSLFLDGADGVNGRELWASDGTSAGTRLVRDVFPGTNNNGNPVLMTNVGGVLFFAARDENAFPIKTYELWRSDGTSAGTVKLDLDPGSYAYPQGLVAVGDRLFTEAYRADVGRELFTVNNTLAHVAAITSTSANGTYQTGQSVNITVTFDAPVVLTGGTLRLTLDSGGTADIAPFSGTSAAGTYTVAYGHASTDLTVTALTLVGPALLRDAGNDPVSLTLPAANLAATADLKINTPNTPPTVADIADRTVAFGTAPGAIAFAIGDIESAPASLTLSATSSNLTLVPVGNIVFGGSGANRTITVTPAAGQSGTTTITVTVTDAAGGTASDSFVLTVNPNTPPTIGDSTDRSTPFGKATGPVTFSVGDLETPAASLTLSAASSNTALVPAANIVFGGGGASRTFNITPAAGLSGTSTITITVTDGAGATSSDSFVLTVDPNQPPTITAIADTVVNAGTTAGPFGFTVGDLESAAAGLTLSAASSNTVLIPLSKITFGGSGANRTVSVATPAGQTGSSVITITVTDPNGGTAARSFTVGSNLPPTISDIPAQNVMATTPLGPVAFTVDDGLTDPGSLTFAVFSSNPSLIPAASVSFGGAGKDRTFTIAPPATAGTATLTFTVTDGQGLTANDSFTVTVTPFNAAPTISDIADRSIVMNATTGTIQFTVGDAETPVTGLVVTASSSDTTLVPNNRITLGGTGTTRTINVAPATGQTGTAVITVTVTDGGGRTASDTFTLTVTPPPNTAPTITDITDKTTAMNSVLGPLGFTVNDAQTPAASLTLSAASTNTTLIPVGNIVFGGSGTSRTVTLTPAAGQSGTATITLTVTDGGGLTASDSFIVTVPANSAPTITAVADLGISMNRPTAALPFTVGDAETAVGSLTLSATSSNTTVVPLANIVFGGTGASRTVTVTPGAYASGTSTITVIVTDGGGATVSEPFTLTVATGLVPSKEFSVGRDRNGQASVTLRNPDNTPRYNLTPFGAGFTGGIRTAAADFTGDGVADLAVASGVGRPGEVYVYDGVDQSKQIFSITPFGAGFTRGILVGAGDLNNDGKADLVITAEQGGGARVRVFQSTGSGFNQRADFFGLIGGDGVADTNFRGGSRGAVADINGDGTGDLIFAAGAGGGPRIAIFDGKSLGSTGGPKLTGDFFALSTTLRDGCFIAGGDFDGDGKDDLVAGGGSGAPPQVVIYSGANLMKNNFTRYADFMFGDPSTRQGVRVAVKNLDNDARADLVLGSAPTAGSRIAAYRGKNVVGGATGAALFDTAAFPGFAGGVFVG